MRVGAGDDAGIDAMLFHGLAQIGEVDKITLFHII